MADETAADREALKAWLRQNLANRGLSPTRAARETKIATTTLTNFLNDDKYKFTPSTPTIAKLERYFGQQAPRTRAFGTKGQGSVMLEGLLVDPEVIVPAVAAALAALIGNRRAIQTWELAGTALEAAGFLRGDLVLVDPHEPPADGDVVCAEVADATTGTRHPVFRVYQKPYLLTAGLDRSPSLPLLVDDKSVMIRGVVTDRISRRRTRPDTGD